MAIEGYYYLHTNGSLIYKHYQDDGMVADFRESDFVRHFWPLDKSNRASAWTIAVEAMTVIGADPARVRELSQKWMLDDEDAQEYAKHIGCQLLRDGNAWGAMRSDFANLQDSPSGWGDTCLEAMAELAKELGFKAQKLWGASFPDLLKQPVATIHGRG